MVKQSSAVSKSRYPVRSEGFDYGGCSAAQSQGPTLGLGGSFLVSYPYMQYTNPNNSRFAPMDALTLKDQSQVMQSMANLVLDSAAYEAAMNRKLQREQANYYRDVAALVNESPNLQKLSSEFEKLNPTSPENKGESDKVVYTEVSMPPKVVRKGSQDIIIPQTQKVVRDVENFSMASSAEHFRPGMVGFVFALLIVLGIIYYASRSSRRAVPMSFGLYY